jgi:lipoate-protein ligase B
MIIDLGIIDYEESYRTQKEFVRLRKLGEIEDSFILAEHYPVFTIGRTGSIDNLLENESALSGKGIKVLRVDRGGDITFHGPGQLVIYPVIDLKKRGSDLHRYLRDLEQFIIGLLKEFAISGEKAAGKTGVWVGGKKIASIGIAASNWITFHGLCLNVSPDLGFFSMINPCGMKGVEMTSISRVLGRTVTMDAVKEKAIDLINANAVLA